jgi:hypothetical protein
MARGWESKGVEGQMEEAQASGRKGPKPPATKEEAERRRQKELLLLSCAHVRHEIENTGNPRRRAQLEQALADLERKLAELPDND